LSKDAPTAEARAEAARVVSERMDRLRLSAAELRRLSGLSVNTIRDITEGTGQPNRSTWIAVSAVLDLPWDYLVNILNGRPEENVAKSPLEKHLAKLVDQHAETDALLRDVVGLKPIIDEIDRKIDVVIGSLHSSGDSQPD
jgi:transcriptional regulator with XRE-family HTH domain